MMFEGAENAVEVAVEAAEVAAWVAEVAVGIIFERDEVAVEVAAEVARVAEIAVEIDGVVGEIQSAVGVIGWEGAGRRGLPLLKIHLDVAFAPERWKQVMVGSVVDYGW